MSQTECYVKLNGNEVGPMSSAVLTQLANQGQVKPDTPIRLGGDGDWFPASRLKGLDGQFAAPPLVPVARNKRNLSAWYWGGGTFAVVTVVTLSVVLAVNFAGRESEADSDLAEYLDQTEGRVQQLQQRVRHDTESVSKQVNRLERKDRWLRDFTNKVSKEESNIGKFWELEKLGFIIKFDHEARNVIVDQFGWDVLSEVENGRLVATGIVSKEIERLTATPMDGPGERLRKSEVTLFSSVSGKSLAYVNTSGETTIFR